MVLFFNYVLEYRKLYGNLIFNGGICDNFVGVVLIFVFFFWMKIVLKIWYFGFKENDIYLVFFNCIY